MSDNGTLRDHLADVTKERNELLRRVELLELRIDKYRDQINAISLAIDTDYAKDFRL
jgi:predicted  nucleic acid-binding Zn-ribbon protein